MHLSEHFTLEEMIRSSTASRRGYKEQFTPGAQIISNLTALCTHVLQPLRIYLGKPIFVSSGFRCPRLNKAVGGVPNSQHQTGEAADLQGIAMENRELFEAIKKAKLPFDQLIVEFLDSSGEPQWIHVSYSIQNNRGEILRALSVDGKTRYTTHK